MKTLVELFLMSLIVGAGMAIPQAVVLWLMDQRHPPEFEDPRFDEVSEPPPGYRMVPTTRPFDQDELDRW